MKILHFIDTLRSGGKERQLVELAKGLASYSDIQQVIVTMSRSVHYSEIYNYNIPIEFLIRSTKKDIRIFQQFYKVCKVFNPDIVHTWDLMPSFYSLYAKSRLKFKLISGIIRDAPPNLKKTSKDVLLCKITFPFTECIIGNSNSGLKAYKSPEKKSVCVYNGFNFDRVKYLCSNEAIKLRFRIKTSKVVGMVASFYDAKDYSTFFKSAEIVLKKYEDVTFISIGSGPNLKKYIEKYKKEPRIKFLGKQKDIESITNIMDIGVLLSNVNIHGEGISNSIMEYMALGKVVIANDNGGNKEIIINNKTGFIINSFDYRELTNCLLNLLNNKSLAIAMGISGKKRIEKKFNISKMIDKTLQIYEMVHSDKIINERIRCF